MTTLAEVAAIRMPRPWSPECERGCGNTRHDYPIEVAHFIARGDEITVVCYGTQPPQPARITVEAFEPAARICGNCKRTSHWRCSGRMGRLEGATGGAARYDTVPCPCECRGAS